MSVGVARPYRLVLFAMSLVAASAVTILAARELLVLFGGVLFALALRGVTKELHRRVRLSYGVALGALVVLLLAAGVVFVVLAGPSIAAQLGELAKALPQALQEVLGRVRLDHGPGRAALTAREAIPDAKTVASGAVSALAATGAAVAALVIVFFVGLYGAAKPHEHAKAILAAMPTRHRGWISAAFEDIDVVLTRWLLGRLVAMAFVGVACAVAFALLKVPLAASLALVAGLFTFVEYVGAVASAVPAVLIAFTRSPSTALAVLIVYTFIHVLEGYVLTPIIARRAAHFPPAITLGAQVTLGALVGPIGLTFSTPLLVVITAFVRAWRESTPRTS